MQIPDKNRTVKEAKAALRTQVLARLSALDEEYLRSSDRKILEQLLALPEFRCAGRLFLYRSVGWEIDTAACIELAQALGKPVALPRILGGGIMDFSAMDSLPEQCFGIPQPDSKAPALRPQAGELVLVPGLCYDRNGYRLGRGGGYYDRLLADCPAYTVGVCRTRFLLESLPRETHDCAVKILITEEKTTRLPEGSPV